MKKKMKISDLAYKPEVKVISTIERHKIIRERVEKHEFEKQKREQELKDKIKLHENEMKEYLYNMYLPFFTDHIKYIEIILSNNEIKNIHQKKIKGKYIYS
jgi:hypothetical protein